MVLNAGEADVLTPERAVAEIRRVENLHGAIARRTAGLVWMVWGIAVPAIFVSYALAFHAFLGTGLSGPVLLTPFLWVPWTVLGWLATRGLWHSAALVAPFDRTRLRTNVLVIGVLVVGLIVAGMGVIRTTGVPVAELAWALMAIGLAAAVLGLTGAGSNDAAERKMWLAASVALLLTALLGSLAFGTDLGLARDAFAVISPVASGVVFFGGGLYLTSHA